MAPLLNIVQHFQGHIDSFSVTGQEKALHYIAGTFLVGPSAVHA